MDDKGSRGRWLSVFLPWVFRPQPCDLGLMFLQLLKNWSCQLSLLLNTANGRSLKARVADLWPQKCLIKYLDRLWKPGQESGRMLRLSRELELVKLAKMAASLLKYVPRVTKEKIKVCKPNPTPKCCSYFWLIYMNVWHPKLDIFIWFTV